MRNITDYVKDNDLNDIEISLLRDDLFEMVIAIYESDMGTGYKGYMIPMSMENLVISFPRERQKHIKKILDYFRPDYPADKAWFDLWDDKPNLLWCQKQLKELDLSFHLTLKLNFFEKIRKNYQFKYKEHYRYNIDLILNNNFKEVKNMGDKFTDIEYWAKLKVDFG